MAPSTSMPTARIRLNSTTIFTGRPSEDRVRMPSRKEPGMAMPTRPAERMPSAPTMTIMTSSTALRTLFRRSVSMVRI